jgi:predicted house-cleaning noncanonical NTP pyrophosphatase (MazG superfamily)
MNMKYDKLVRDKIPEIIRSGNKKPITHIAKGPEYWDKLTEKLREEVDEFIKDVNQEEIADILEIIHTICEYKGYDRKNIEKIRINKAKERGAFKKRLILEKTI